MINQRKPTPAARLFRIFALCFGLAIGYVLLDFAIDLRPSNIDASYQFRLPALDFDQPLIVSEDNLSIVVIRRSARVVASLQRNTSRLQDPESKSSRQPRYAENGLRSRQPEYFVAYALGTDLGCLLTAFDEQLGEICGPARYDFAGRSLRGEHVFQNLAVPDYNFDDDFNTLTIRP